MCMRARGAMTLLFSMCVHCLRSRHGHTSPLTSRAGRWALLRGAWRVRRGPPVDSRVSTLDPDRTLFQFICVSRVLTPCV